MSQDKDLKPSVGDILVAMDSGKLSLAKHLLVKYMAIPCPGCAERDELKRKVDAYALVIDAIEEKWAGLMTALGKPTQQAGWARKTIDAALSPVAEKEPARRDLRGEKEFLEAHYQQPNIQKPASKDDGLRAQWEAVAYSMKQAQIPGNDWRREIEHTKRIAEASLSSLPPRDEVNEAKADERMTYNEFMARYLPKLNEAKAQAFEEAAMIHCDYPGEFEEKCLAKAAALRKSQEK